MRRKLGSRPIIAEDLGLVTPGDIRLRDAFGFAPMRIFQFGFGPGPDSAHHLPHEYPRLCAAYTGNHDNNTIAGWFCHLSPAEKRRVMAYAGGSDTAIPSAFLRTLMASSAGTVIFPMQDILGLDQRARMNTPGTGGDNWTWRLPPVNLDRPARQLRALVDVFNRNAPARNGASLSRGRREPGPSKSRNHFR